MKYLTIALSLLGVALLVVIALRIVGDTQGNNDGNGQALCDIRRIVIDSEVIGREALDSGEIGGYVLSSVFAVRENESVEAGVLDADQGLVFGSSPSILIVAAGATPDRKIDARFPAPDDQGLARLEVDSGDYQVYTPSNGARIQIALCSRAAG